MTPTAEKTEGENAEVIERKFQLKFFSSMTFDKWIQLFTAILLAVTAVATYNSYLLSNEAMKRSALLQSEIAGNVSWERFRDLQLDFRNSPNGRNYVYPSGDKMIDGDYELLSERLLMAADVITVVAEVDKSWKDKQWAHSFAYEFRNHSDYFLSPAFLTESNGLMSSYCTYRSPVRRWLKASFEAKGYEKALRKVSEAEDLCVAICRPEEGCT
jgi:hypothetical protein